MTDTANFTKEDLVRKIAGLLATAESFAEQGNDEAAQTYVQKAHALQAKYSIDQAMLADQTGQKTEKIISKKVRMPGKWGKQKVHLAHVIAHATNCTGYHTTSRYVPNEDGLYGERSDTKIYYYTVFGFESDVEHVEFLINSLSMQMDAALSAAQMAKPSWEHGRSFNASFMQGYSGSISSRLHAANREARKNADVTYGSQSTALVLVDKKKQVEDEMRAQVGRLRKGSSSETTSGHGYSAGRDAGSRATIARGGVGGGSRGSLGR